MQQVLFNKIDNKDIWFRKENCKYYIVDTERKLKRLVEIMRTADVVSYDIETTGLSPQDSDIIGFSLCSEPGLAFYLPVNHYNKSQNIPLDMIKSYIGPILQEKPIIGHNLKFEYKFTKTKFGIEINSVYDTFIISKLYELFDSCALKDLAEVLFGFTVIELDTILDQYGISNDKANLLKVEELYEYCCQDTDLSLRLFNYFVDFGWKPDFIYDLEKNLIKVLANIELRGIKVDYQKLLEIRKSYNERIDFLGTKIASVLCVDHNFNINSNKKFSEAFLYKFKGMKSKVSFNENSPVMKMDELSVNKYEKRFSKYLELNGLEQEDNIFTYYKERKSLFSLLTKYVDSWIDRVETKKTTTIYTNFNSLGAGTGRMSSNDPNFQNVSPIIRKAIVPRKGYYFFSMDYDQVEYRILAAMAGLKHLTEEINKEGADVHEIAASLLFEIPKDDVTKELRKKTKTLNFGVLYGMGIKKLAESLSVSEEEAKDLKKKYDERFLGKTPWFRKVKAFAKKNGYVLTAYGRKRVIDNIQLTIDPFADKEEQDEIKRLLGEANRKAINTPIQGTSADIIKLSLLNIDDFLIKSGLDIHVLLIIHDEIFFEVNEKYDTKFVKESLKPIMEIKNFKDCVDLTVGNKVSDKSWGDLADA